MAGITIYEFEALVAKAPGALDADGLRVVPLSVFTWLESQALRAAEGGEEAWVRVTQRRGRRDSEAHHGGMGAARHARVGV